MCAGSKRLLTSTEVLDGDWEVDKVIGMVRRAGATHVAVRWRGYGAEGDTWEREANVHPASKIAEFNEDFDVHLGMAYVRNTILNSMLGKTLRDRVPRYRHMLEVPQLCFELRRCIRCSRAGFWRVARRLIS